MNQIESVNRASSMPQMMLASIERWDAKPAMLVHNETGWSEISYREMKRLVFELSCRLTELGVQKQDAVAILADNSSTWALLDWAILSIGAVTVPIYPTLPSNQVAYLLKDSCAKFAFAGRREQCVRLRDAAASCELPLRVISMTESVESFESLMKTEGVASEQDRSDADWEQAINRIQPDEIATLIYTSGTTGDPKGVMLTHRNFLFLCEAILDSIPVSERDRFVSFLPLSHVYERFAGHFLPIACGAEIAYARSIRTLADDIISARPTVLLAVPRFVTNVRDRIEASAKTGSALKRMLLKMTVAGGAARLRNKNRPIGLIGWLLDRIVGSKVRARFGGRLRFLVSGGASLPGDVAEFFGSFGIPVLQGYGLTETAPVVSMNHPERNDYTSVGEVLPGIEVRIADDGEILVRGPSVMSGYWNKEELTRQAIDPDGWFHTGDLGRMEERRLWVTGRKKDIIVMSNGKNVAPEAIENLLKTSPFIEEAMVIGDEMDYLAALIVPSLDRVREYCRDRGVTVEWASVSDIACVQELIKGEIAKANKNLADFEVIKRFKVVSQAWTEEGGELTPTLKIKRRVIHTKYADEIAGLRQCA